MRELDVLWQGLILALTPWPFVAAFFAFVFGQRLLSALLLAGGLTLAWWAWWSW